MRTLIILVFILLISAARTESAEQQDQPQTAQPTRTEQWKEKRLQKQSELTPYRLSKIERILVNREKKSFGEPLGTRFGDVYITQGGITTGAGFLAATVRYFRANIFDTPLDITASAGYSYKGYNMFGFAFGNILRKSPELFLRHSGVGGLSQFEKTRQTEGDFYYYIEILSRHFPEEDFYGIGNNSEEDNRTDFTLDAISYDAVTAWRLGSNVGAFLQVGLLQPDISGGTDDTYPGIRELYDDATAPGLDEQPDFVRLATGIFLDYRDVFGNPSNGGMYNFIYGRYFDQGENDFDFHRFALDLRQYIPLGSEQRILAVRFYSSFDDPAGNARIPFYLMQTIGGSDSIRGYSDFRFRDKNLFFISTEYRWIPHPVWELVLFYDTGKVFPELSDFDFNDLKSGYGVGMRLKSTEDTALRFDVGRSKEGLHFYVKWNASF